MTNIRIEHVADINFKYPYLEVFEGSSLNPFLEIGIDDNKVLVFKFYTSINEIELSIIEIENFMNIAKEFLIETLKNEDEINKWENRK